MTTNKPKTFGVDLTLGQIVTLAEIVRKHHSDYEYYASKYVTDDDDGWQARETRSARKRQADCSDLLFSLIGETLDPSPVEVPESADA